MDCLLPSRLIQRLSFFEDTSKNQLIAYLSLLLARHYAQTTLDSIIIAVRSLVLSLPEQRKTALANHLTQTTASDIDRLIDASRSRGLAASTINGHLSMLKELFDLLRKDGQMQTQPVIRRRHRLPTPTTLPKPIAEADLPAFFKVIDSVRDRLIFLLMLRCSLRVSEACSLTWNDIDLEASSIRINNGKGQVDRALFLLMLRSGLRVSEVAQLKLGDIDWQQKALLVRQGKGRKDRRVYLSADTIEGLRECLAIRPAVVAGEYFFWNQRRRNQPLSIKAIQKKIERYAKAGQVAASCHSLRHTFASNLLEVGAEVISIKEFLGHQSISSSERYARLSNQKVKQVYLQTIKKMIQKVKV